MELDLFESLRGAEGTEVVTQADPCPGNVLVTEDHARFVDYEATSIHHPAVDVVNLVMPWSSCDGLVGVPAEFLDAVREGFLDGSRYAGSWLADEPMIGLAGTAAYSRGASGRHPKPAISRTIPSPPELCDIDVDRKHFAMTVRAPAVAVVEPSTQHRATLVRTPS